MSADGRFAPSPTGPLHLGSLRTALAAWLFARSAGAAFRLRIEDLDPQRSRAEHERSQVADLRALGIDWDGPAVRQSERRAAHDAAIDALAASGRLYPCFCTRAEIREAASAPHGALPDGAYPGTCRGLSRAERAARLAARRPFALRLAAEGARVEFSDRLLGRCGGTVDDFVVRRSDGVPSYQLAVVVDDAEQGIGEVVRGADLVDSTPRQIVLARLLGLPVPRYAHLALVLGPDGARLAKRHGSGSAAGLDAEPSRILTRLARSLGLARDGEAVEAPEQLLGEFDPARLPRAPVRLEALLA